MSLAVADRDIQTMSARAFRRFQAERPDRERWELVAGRPVMMAPASLAHNRIASNLERLLNDALEPHDPSRLACQRPGIELGSDDRYRPEPDVAVIDADYEAGQRFVGRAYLLAEIVSGTDRETVAEAGRRWIDIKRDLYRAHATCEAVLIVEQERPEVEVSIRTVEGWRTEIVSGFDGRLALPSFGFEGELAALYEGTPLRPRGGG
ncbi:Uma2 family endonuclease [Methylorubrum sp. SB2]|uniref:Uma2 family endonuclease n=1 Tax=Methylorubrum subtropicum TaxID=3138812 RepID=UPI00313C53D6